MNQTLDIQKALEERLEEVLLKTPDDFTNPETGEVLSKEEALAALREYMVPKPLVRQYTKLRRNIVCPFCSSGKKFKKCECYERYLNDIYAPTR